MKSSDVRRTTAEELLYLHFRLGLQSRLRSEQALLDVLSRAEEELQESIRSRMNREEPQYVYYGEVAYWLCHYEPFTEHNELVAYTFLWTVANLMGRRYCQSMADCLASLRKRVMPGSYYSMLLSMSREVGAGAS